MSSLAVLRDRLAVARAGDRVLPMHPSLGRLLPEVQRGWVVGCSGSSAVSLALTVLARPTTDGSWACVLGLPGLDGAAAAEHGVALQRLVVVDEPATGFTESRWGELVAAALDGFDVVLLGPALHTLRPATARRLVARAQSRGAVLVAVRPERGALSTDVVLRGERVHWHGLGQGHGVLRQRRVEVLAEGRRLPRGRRDDWVWPPSAGVVPGEVADASATVVTFDPVDELPLQRTG